MNTSSQPEPELVAWALVIDHLQVVVVLEPGYLLDAPPSLHAALTVVVAGSAERVLNDAGRVPRP